MLAFGRIAPVLVPSPRVKVLLWPFLEDVDMAVSASNIVTLASLRASSELSRLAFAEHCSPPYHWLTFMGVVFSSREDQDRSESRFPKFKGFLFS